MSVEHFDAILFVLFILQTQNEIERTARAAQWPSDAKSQCFLRILDFVNESEGLFRRAKKALQMACLAHSLLILIGSLSRAQRARAAWFLISCGQLFRVRTVVQVKPPWQRRQNNNAPECFFGRSHCEGNWSVMSTATNDERQALDTHKRPDFLPWRVMKWVWTLENGLTQHIAIALAHKTPRNGELFVEQTELATMTRHGRTSVRAAIKELLELGYLLKAKRTMGGFDIVWSMKGYGHTTVDDVGRHAQISVTRASPPAG